MTTPEVSSYLRYLPTLFQENADEEGVSFIGRFLLAFEKILSGFDDPDELGLEEILDRIHTYFAPLAPTDQPLDQTPTEFLPWLAGWVALSLREDWTEEEKRRLLSRIVPLYRQRGTKTGLADLLHTYTGMGVEILEFNQALQLGVVSTVGKDTSIGGGSPHYFLVKLVLETLDDLNFERRKQIARAIIDQEKPAHTYYDLIFEFPTMQIGVTSTVGEDTLLGTSREL